MCGMRSVTFVVLCYMSCCVCVCVVLCCVVFDVFVCVLCLQSEGVDGAGGAGGGDGRARHVHARAGGARDAPGPARAAPRCLSPRTRQNDSGKETRPRKPRHEKKTKAVRFLFFFSFFLKFIVNSSQ